MASPKTLIDTGPIVSIFRTSQTHHLACVEALKNLSLPLYTCWPVLTESAYLLRSRPDEVQAMLAALQMGFFSLLHLDEYDALEIQGVLEKYQDQNFDLADACLMHLAEREGLEQVFTLDRKDFAVFKTYKGSSLKMFPFTSE